MLTSTTEAGTLLNNVHKSLSSDLHGVTHTEPDLSAIPFPSSNHSFLGAPSSLRQQQASLLSGRGSFLMENIIIIFYFLCKKRQAQKG